MAKVTDLVISATKLTLLKSDTGYRVNLGNVYSAFDVIIDEDLPIHTCYPELESGIFLFL